VSAPRPEQPNKWRRDGKELFFLSLDSKLMAVDIEAGRGIVAGVPHALFQTAITDPLGAPYDVSSGGQRFLGRCRKIGIGGRTYHSCTELVGGVEKQVATMHSAFLAQRHRMHANAG
jgi:hypothetical protein